MHSVSKQNRMDRAIAVCLILCGVLSLLPGRALGEVLEQSNSGVRKRSVSARIVVAGTALQNSMAERDRNGHRGFAARLLLDQGPGAVSSPSFSVAAVRDIYFYTFWRRLSGGHVQTVLLYAPDGTLYQTRLLPISTVTPPSPTQLVPGVENALDVQETFALGHEDISTVQFPIDGTWVTDHRLLGTWKVDVLLDGVSTPVASGTFTLTE